MILKIAALPEDVPKQLESEYDAREWDIEFIDLHYSKKILMEGIAERIKQTVTFRGTLASRIEQICARCLEPQESDLLAPFDLSYDIQGRETIDTTADLRDILILRHPDRFLCRSDCRGICPYCGANLNRESCQCKSSIKQPLSWQPLKEKLKKRED
ncbi:MAG: DUF177 domain-containing protein [Candidatus Omnitrophica bacterium]|nr:DUF177 domain-containing protein [Candidatus Omnitrophota bacterium]